LKVVDLSEREGLLRFRLGVPSPFHRDWIKAQLNGPIREVVAREVPEYSGELRLAYEVLEPAERQLDVFEAEGEDENDEQMERGHIRDAVPTVASVYAAARKGALADPEASGAQPRDDGAAPEPAPGHPSDAASDTAGAETGSKTHHGGDAEQHAPSERRRGMLRRQQSRDEQGKRTTLQRAPHRQGAFQQAPSQGHVHSMARELGVRLGAWDNAYSFERFIEGDGNSLARAASIAVAERPGNSTYNPLFIYGGVGLGKTHLAHAIARRAEQLFDEALIAYVPSSQFVEQFVSSIRSGDMATFTSLYRSVDILIVDDVQFLSGKEKTQEEFFHLFDDLHNGGSQIVLCADRSPREIDNIGNRLMSRFQWGLSTDVQPPDLETRTAIIYSKAESLNLQVGNRTVEWLATTIVDSIREIEGALNRLKLYAEMGESITLDLARRELSDLASPETRRLTVGHIRETVAAAWNVRSHDLCARTRKHPIVTARHVAMYLAREFTDKSLADIGAHFGGRDHSTVINACQSVQDRIDTEPAFAQHVEQACTRLGRPSTAA
jgi:chromosomal replication initiator protein